MVALSGGVVGNEAAFELVRRRCMTVWLRAKPEDHMARVLAQGDRRPVANRENAMGELRAILAAREPLYGRSAISIDTSAGDIEEAVLRLGAALREHGWSTA